MNRMFTLFSLFSTNKEKKALKANERFSPSDESLKSIMDFASAYELKKCRKSDVKVVEMILN